MQINFLIEKNLDANQFFNCEKFRSASNENANQFLIWENFRFASNEDANHFFYINMITSIFLKEKKKILKKKML